MEVFANTGAGRVAFEFGPNDTADMVKNKIRGDLGFPSAMHFDLQYEGETLGASELMAARGCCGGEDFHVIPGEVMKRVRAVEENWESILTGLAPLSNHSRRDFYVAATTLNGAIICSTDPSQDDSKKTALAVKTILEENRPSAFPFRGSTFVTVQHSPTSNDAFFGVSHSQKSLVVQRTQHTVLVCVYGSTLNETYAISRWRDKLEDSGA
eukprot:TRINITY_DN24219_c0_g1_i1.p1 TRINITY_DN24219_c0_g1~~TRINITY_DN24219_c0_g1_i1.p1  ORF type:complete len:211 (+),score=23.31 TRINITY_DN24219_c0_g1_i1:36-668(+)